MSVYIVDTETTGAEPPEVIELAVVKPTAPMEFQTVVNQRFRPRGRILNSALAVHHILPEELEQEPSSETAKGAIPLDMEYMIGHGVDYDWEALGRPACKRICTLAISRYIWPGNDGHSLSAIAYALSANLRETRELLRGAHGAHTDAIICYGILHAMLQQPQVNPPAGFTWEWLYQFSENARIPRVWSFGKHKGKDVATTDKGYLNWVLYKADDMDPYVKEAARRALAGQLLP